LSELKRRRREEPDGPETEAYVVTAVGMGLLVAAAFVISTAGVLAAGFPFVLGAAACLGWGISKFAQQRRSLQPATGERELLAAIRENGGSITPAEAAMETSLTVREADQMLSELASGGHLKVESEGGTLFYSLPGRRGREIEG
jgi:hypothetical protein